MNNMELYEIINALNDHLKYKREYLSSPQGGFLFVEDDFVLSSFGGGIDYQVRINYKRGDEVFNVLHFSHKGIDKNKTEEELKLKLQKEMLSIIITSLFAFVSSVYFKNIVDNNIEELWKYSTSIKQN